MEKIDPLKFGVSPKQQSFCEYYVSNGFNATQACRQAGYSTKTSASQGSRLLKDEKVKKYINYLQQQIANNVDLSKEALLMKLNKMLDTSAEGVQLKAIDMIAKLNGYYAPEKQEVTYNKYSELEDKLEGMSAEELEEYIQSMDDESDDKPNLKRVK